ncbi:MAG: winged helix-turn-helix transcriptional regulator [Planctomycetes bacterium]|nr:winged helix-turn-helix transcriptional regulator [Planctomycetota bacterium]MBI3848420.1 winged helix-turn-helix transcriptional regulator [Planctomycetota bacterium]
MSRHRAHDDVFLAIADPTRRRILELLAEEERPVNALAEPFHMSLPAVSQHLRKLRHAGLVSQRCEGRQRVYCLNPARLKEVADWVATYERFWSGKLDALGRYLDKRKEKR